jgi:heme-degrading monooxygenase HmoA
MTVCSVYRGAGSPSTRAWSEPAVRWWQSLCLRTACGSVDPYLHVLLLEGVALIAVISEVWPYPHRRNDYFILSEELRPLLHAIDGFISVERFESPTEPGKFVSLSFWRDEAALSHWRNLEQHRIVMEKGRGGILRDYRIRVTSVLWDYSMSDRAQAPKDSRARLG